MFCSQCCLLGSQTHHTSTPSLTTLDATTKAKRTDQFSHSSCGYFATLNNWTFAMQSPLFLVNECCSIAKQISSIYENTGRVHAWVQIERILGRSHFLPQRLHHTFIILQPKWPLCPKAKCIFYCLLDWLKRAIHSNLPRDIPKLYYNNLWLVILTCNTHQIDQLKLFWSVLFL